MRLRSLCLTMLCLAAVSPLAAQDQNALEVIEQTRGGRHWVDEKTAPPKSPEESLACLEVEPGVRIELVAAEPIVRDPVAIAFSHRGTMFVVEYGDYPVGPEDGGKPLSKVVLLLDSDGDGRMDQRKLFADGLEFAHSLMPYRDGVLVGAKTEILHLRDTVGDGKADVREVLFDGFTPAHPQMQIGNPRWGMDNWIHLNYGPGSVSSGDDGPRTKLPRKEVRFNPRTMQIEADSGMGQFGNTIDRWGNRFYCTNRNPIIATMLSPKVLTRNPFAVITGGHYDIAPSGGDTRVYPLVAMKSNYLSHAGTHTSACGVTAYLGDLFNPEFQSSVFVCEPIGHLVTRSVIEPDGPALKARRAREKADFIASTDTWFRPASLATGPDGALYLADMYRLWVEHPKFLPPEIAAKLDWRAGEDRGRIYRIVPQNHESSRYTFDNTDGGLFEMLRHNNAWRQQTAHRLLVERNAVGWAVTLAEVAGASWAKPTMRLRALAILDGIDRLTADVIVTAMQAEHPVVRRDACRLASKFLNDEKVLKLLHVQVADEDASVRLQALLTLAESESAELSGVLADVIQRDVENQWFRKAVVSSAKAVAGKTLGLVLDSTEFRATGTQARMDMVQQLAASAAARGDVDELRVVMASLTDNQTNAGKPAWWQAATINGLGQGLLRHRGAMGRTSLSRLVSSPPDELRDEVKAVAGLLKQAVDVAVDDTGNESDRVAAIELAAMLPFDQLRPLASDLLMLDQPTVIQSAVLSALERSRQAGAADVVLDRFSEISTSLRSRALALLFRRKESTVLALNAMREKRLPTSGLTVDQRARLLKHADDRIRTLATELLGGAVSADRLKVAQQYEQALKLDANADSGAKVFRRVCAECHQLGGEGNLVGPDISDVRNRSRAALLYDILDPNAKVEPRFTAYNVLTSDGRIFSGLIKSETADSIVLSMQAGKQMTLTRDDIDELTTSQKSLMPEGVEKVITVQQMADLLEYLKNREL